MDCLQRAFLRGCDVDVITGENAEELAARIGEYGWRDS
jgi:hypothetical protein